MPQFWIVAGPNGAGKTTIADRWLATRIPVVSPDAIAASRAQSPIQAGKAAIIEAEHLLAAGASFAIDTTLAGNRELTMMKRASDAGYKVNLIFVGVKNIETCQGRILERVEGGGHNVPPADVLRRYARSLAHLKDAISIADRVFVLDNSGENRRLLLSVEHGRVKHLSSHLPLWANMAIPSRLTRSNNLGLG